MCNTRTLQETFENQPFLLKNALSTASEGSNCWKLFDWSLEEFAEKCGDTKLSFRVGKNDTTIQPQWEVDTPVEYKTMSEFLNAIKNDSDPTKWYYFDYKRMNEWFKEKSSILQSINWKQFDLELDGSDSTIWIGSKGAHTICHQDTYGCNLVAQTHGRKLWLLLSPECSNFMQSTRIPYEESTIYSKLNFFAPGKTEIQAIKNMPGSVQMIILEPKDVLFIPNGWWHYVESLDTSISVNVWLPVKEDCAARLKETLVHLVVNSIGDGISKTVNQPETNLLECIQLVETSLKECKQEKSTTVPLKKQKKIYFDNASLLHSFQRKFKNIQSLPNLTSDNISDFLKKNNFAIINDTEEKDINEIDEPSMFSILEATVDAFCHPDVILKVSEILRNNFV